VIKVWSGTKLGEILQFLAPQFFEVSAPEFVDLHYKTQPASDHVAKFDGDRSRVLGERVAKQKKISSKT